MNPNNDTTEASDASSEFVKMVKPVAYYSTGKYDIPAVAELEAEIKSEGTATPEPATPPSALTKIVLTGGPCGGKTTALSEVADRLRSLGLQVFTQPEVSTTLSVAGAGFPAAAGAEYREGWESARLRFQLAMEDCFGQIARASGQPTVLLCDRGAGDASAYHDAESWPRIARAALPEGFAGDAGRFMVDRYDLVLHLVSCAIGAPEHYTKDGNSARRESPEEAVEVDRRIRAAWDTHANRRVIDNQTDFAGKIRRVVTAICGHLGVLSPQDFRKLFVVSRAKFVPPPDVSVEEYDVTYTFLDGSTEDDNSCVRIRTHKGQRSITYARKFANGEIVERIIGGREALALLERRSPHIPSLTRKRHVFITDSHYFQLNDHNNNECLLAVEVASPTASVVFPAWLKPAVIKEIDPNNATKFSLFQMALRLGKLPVTPPLSPTPGHGGVIV